MVKNLYIPISLFCGWQKTTNELVKAMQWGGHCIAFAQSKRIQAKKGDFFCNNIVVDPNAPTGQQQPAQGSALGKGHVRRTRWKCKSTTRCRCCSQCFCPCRALACCIPLTQGDALGYERVGLSGRSLSERVNCDIIANPLSQSLFFRIVKMC